MLDPMKSAINRIQEVLLCITFIFAGHQPKSLTDLTVVCALCTAKISNNLSCMIAHVKVHLDYKPLKCDYCTFKYFSMSRIRRHNSKVHPDKPVKVSYHPIPDIGKKIKEMKKRCFGSTSSGSAATTTFTTSISTSANEDEESMGDEDNDSPLTDVSRNSPADTNTGYGSQNAQLNVSSLLRNLIKNQFPDQQQANSVSKNRSLTDNLVAFNHRPGASNNISSTSLQQGQFSDSIVASNGQSVQKRLCRLCNTYIANSTSAFENHASRHLNYKPYSCAACSYKSYVRGKVSRHSLQVHGVRAPRGVVFKPLPGMKEKMRQVKLKCFYNPYLDQQDLIRKNGDNNDSASPSNNSGGYPNQLIDVATVDLSGNEDDDNNSTDSFSGAGSLALPVSNGQDGSELSRSKLPCAICFEWVADDSVLLKSHAAIHASSTTYMCSLCEFRDSSEARFREHAMNVHGDMHLKPYRCPFCTYMSCEQSKARRHVENVHNLSGDKIHIFEENDIKDKLVVVKAQCFPSLSQLPPNETRKSVINIQDSAPEPVIASKIDVTFSVFELVDGTV
uniref:C2H2-type domain-containing protein n=1 Tax=Romanomermis culicivorax TaxID=13658 RepID=A0A915KYM5_ROMCU